MKDQPLWKYKVKSSHNSYSDSALSGDADPEITRKILEHGFRSIELDIHQDDEGNLGVRHMSTMKLEPLEGFLQVIDDFMQNSTDLLMIAFDLKEVGYEQKLADVIEKRFAGKFIDAPIKKVKGKYNWPLLKDCQSKLFVSMHKIHHKSLNKTSKSIFHIDDDGYFKNYAYNKMKGITRYFKRRKMFKLLDKGVMVRMYPPAWNNIGVPKFFKKLSQNIRDDVFDFEEIAAWGCQLISVDDYTREEIKQVYDHRDSYLLDY